MPRRPYLLFHTLLAGVLAFGATGCATVMNQVGKVAARVMTGSTDDLGAVNYMIVYTDQAVPTASGEASIAALGDWQDRAPLLSSVLFKRDGVGMLNLQGDGVTLDGAPLPRTFPGAYSAFLDAPAAGPMEVGFASELGQNEAFEVQPRPPVRIVRVNGQAPENATIDLGEPLVLELDREASDAADLRVALLGSTMGVKGFWDVAVVRAADRIELPAAVWTHTQGNPINTGSNWLKVEEYVRPEPQPTPSGGQAFVVAYASDFAPVTVTGSRADNLVGVASRAAATLRGIAEAGGREVTWTAVKPVAFQSPPLSWARRLAPATLKVEARELSQSSTSTSERSGGPGVTVTTTTTRSRQFAQLGDAFWEALLVDLYDGITQRLDAHTEAEWVPVQAVTEAEAYARFPAVQDANRVSYVRHAYGGLRDLDALSFTSLFEDVSGPYGPARLDGLMRELDADGLVTVELDLAMPAGEFSLAPTLTFRILAPQADPMQAGGAPSYVDITVAGEGREVTNEMLDDAAQLRAFLPTAINLDALLDAFGQALDATVAFEAEQPIYRAVWDGRSAR